MHLHEAFRQLREEWFRTKLLVRPHERVWETQEESDRREKDNEKLHKEYNLQTEEIILGKSLDVSPITPIDVYNRMGEDL
jgi:hypothetical protein